LTEVSLLGKQVHEGEDSAHLPVGVSTTLDLGGLDVAEAGEELGQVFLMRLKRGRMETLEGLNDLAGYPPTS